MSSFTRSFLVLLSLIALAFSSVSVDYELSQKQVIRSTILDNFKHDVKTLYKVFCFIYNKSYDHSSIETANRLEIFQENLKRIEEHNRTNSSYKKGINHMTDMTFEERKKFYNLKPIKVPELVKSVRKLNSFNLDDYNDEEDEIPNPTSQKLTRPSKSSDHRGKMKPVRSQGECGSCWAFTTQAVLEGFFNSRNSNGIPDHFSTQQSVDCDSGNNGCNGGWFSASFTYFTKNYIMWDKDYRYVGEKQTCKYNATKNSGFKITGFNWFYYVNKNYDVFNSMLNNGPVAVAVDAGDSFTEYTNGVFDGPCTDAVNHAVTLVGYTLPSTGYPEGYYIIRNSWGEDWGESGHIRIKVNQNNFYSCGVEKFGYQPTL